MKKPLLLAFMAALGLQVKAQNFVPVTLTGFTADIIADGAGPAVNSTNADVDGASNTFVSQNYVNPANQSPSTFLPANGTISSAATPGLTFQLAPYTGNNSLRITNASGAGTLTFATPRPADQVYILATTAYPSTFTATVNFTDATSQIFTGNAVTNWFDGTSTAAIKGISRVKRTTDAIENLTTNPRIYQFLLTLNAANITKPIQSITFTKTTTAANEILHIMGASIRPVASTLPNDVGVTAFTSPVSGCNLTNLETISVDVTNFGSAPQSNIPVSYSINGGAAVNEIIAGPIASNATFNYSFTAKANLSAINTYNLVATTGLTGDAQMANNSTNKTVTMAAAPASPTLSVSGATTFCPGSTVVLSASGAAGATYQWFKNGTVISGATSNIYAANTAGSYTAVTNANGCSSSVSAPVNLTLATAPVMPIVSASGATTFCTGGSLTLTASSATTGATFSWLKNGNTIPGATGATYSVNSTGTYTVMAVSGGCSSAVSSATNVIVNNTPVTPTISQAGNVLTSSSGIGNQWFMNGSAISGANAKTYTAAASGTYTVAVTSNSCSSVASNAVNITIAGIKEENAAAEVLIYPNPNNGKFELQLSGVQKNGSIEIYSITGKLIANFLFAANGNKTLMPISLQNIAAGSYFLKITSNKTVKVERLIIE